MARIGLRSVLNSVSVMFMVLMLTGSTRLRPKMNRISGGFALAGEAEPLRLPSSAPMAPAEHALLLRVHHQLQGGELRGDAELLGQVSSRVELVRGVQPDVERDRLVLHRDQLLLLQFEQIGELGVALRRTVRWGTRGGQRRPPRRGPGAPGKANVSARLRVSCTGLNWNTTISGGRLRPNSTKAPRKILGLFGKPSVMIPTSEFEAELHECLVHPFVVGGRPQHVVDRLDLIAVQVEAQATSGLRPRHPCGTREVPAVAPAQPAI